MQADLVSRGQTTISAQGVIACSISARAEKGEEKGLHLGLHKGEHIISPDITCYSCLLYCIRTRGALSGDAVKETKITERLSHQENHQISQRK